MKKPQETASTFLLRWVAGTTVSRCYGYASKHSFLSSAAVHYFQVSQFTTSQFLVQKDFLPFQRDDHLQRLYAEFGWLNQDYCVLIHSNGVFFVLYCHSSMECISISHRLILISLYCRFVVVDCFVSCLALFMHNSRDIVFAKKCRNWPMGVFIIF